MVLSYGKILEEEENASEEISTSDNGSDIERIKSLTLKTFYWVVILLTLFTTLFVTVFPYKSIKTYSDLNLRTRALESAERYVAIHEKEYADSKNPPFDSKFADAVLAKVRLSISLMDSSITKYGYFDAKTVFYSEKADKYIQEYLEYGSLRQRSALISNYDIANTTPSSHVKFYSFDTYLLQQQVKAKYLSGKQLDLFNYFVIETYSFPTVIDETNVESFIRLFYQLDAALSIESASSSALTSNNFRLLINKTDYAPFGENGAKYEKGKSVILIRLEEHIDAFKSFVISYNDRGEREYSLRKLYYAKAVVDVISRVRNVLWIMETSGNFNYDTDHDILDIYSHWNTTYYAFDESRTMPEWFIYVLVPSYTALF